MRNAADGMASVGDCALLVGACCRQAPQDDAYANVCFRLQLSSLIVRPPTATPRLHLITVSNEKDNAAMLEMIRIASRFGMHATVLTFQSDEFLMSKLRVSGPQFSRSAAHSAGRQGPTLPGCYMRADRTPAVEQALRDFCVTLSVAGAGTDLVLLVDAWDVVLRGPEEAIVAAYKHAVGGRR